MCVGFALFLCYVVALLKSECGDWNVLLDLIKHIYKGSGIGITSHPWVVSLCEFAYLCRLIEGSTSLLSSVKMLAVDALIIVKLLSHRHTVGLQNEALRHREGVCVCVCVCVPCGFCELHDMFSNSAASSSGL